MSPPDKHLPLCLSLYLPTHVNILTFETYLDLSVKYANLSYLYADKSLSHCHRKHTTKKT